MDHFRARMALKIPPEKDILDGENVSVDDFLGGAVRLVQPRAGYRVSMDTVMLAASVPASAGERVIEGGVGSAGAALCLACRVPGVFVHGIDVQDEMIRYARRNIDFNEAGQHVSVEQGDVRELVGQAGTYDHAFINPPYLAAGKAIRAPVENKGLAHMDQTAALKDWVRFCLYHVRHKGTISIIYRADRLDELLTALYQRVGDLRILPLWPRAGVPAKRVIVQGRKGVMGASALLSGFVLHGDVERYTPQARKILWDGGALSLAVTGV